MKYTYISYGTLTIMLVYVIYYIFTKTHNIIYTCTTFFDFEKEDKWAAFEKGMTSIRTLHSDEFLNSINKWLVVNEYSDNPKTNWAEKIKSKFPFITFIQKTKEQKGHPTSLNIIMNHVKYYNYWIMWEESWFCNRPCLDRALYVVKTTPITQLQLTRDEEYVHWSNKPRQCNYDVGWCIINKPTPNPEDLKKLTEFDDDRDAGYTFAPLFSLRPSINKVTIYMPTRFVLDKSYEYTYAKQWYLLEDSVKGILTDGPVARSKKHTHTY